MSALPTIENRHALVTGGGRGIGAAVVAALARDGANVTVAGRNSDTVEKSCASMRDQFPGRTFNAVTMDVTDTASVESGFDRARQNLGPVAVLVNNAGAAESALFVDTDEELFQRMLDANLLGTFRCCRCAVGGMMESAFGRIVNIASTAGLMGYRYVSAYTAAKHGVVGLTRALALELAGSGVTINAVCPGYVDTDMTDASARGVARKTGRSVADIKGQLAAVNPQGRLLTPAEVAERVAWLCRPAQSGINGEAVMIDDREEEK